MSLRTCLAICREGGTILPEVAPSLGPGSRTEVRGESSLSSSILSTSYRHSAKMDRASKWPQPRLFPLHTASVTATENASVVLKIRLSSPSLLTNISSLLLYLFQEESLKEGEPAPIIFFKLSVILNDLRFSYIKKLKIQFLV